MYKKALTLILLVSIFSSAFSQDIKTKWGDPDKNISNMQLIETFGSFDGDAVYSLFTNNKRGHFFIEKYSSDAKVVFNKEIEIITPTAIDPNSTFNLKKVLYLNDEIYLFSSFYDRKSETRYLYVNTVSRNGDLDRDMKKLDEINDVKTPEENYTIIPSEDSTKLCIFYPGHFNKDENEKIIIHVVDAGLKDIWNKKIQLPYTSNQFHLDEVKIDNFGNAFISGSDRLKGDEAKGRFDYKYVLISYLWESGSLKEYNLNLEDKYINNFYFVIDKSNNIRASGFYVNKTNSLLGQGSHFNSRGNYLNGYFYLLINTRDQEIDKKIAKDFDANFLKNFPRTKDLKHIKTKRLYVAENGTLNIIAEQNYTYTRANGQSSSFHYCSDNIIVLNMTEEGILNWEAVIPKHQDMVVDWLSMLSAEVEGRDEQPEMLHSIIMPYKNSIYLVYNDVTGNSKKTDPKKLKKYRRPGKTEMIIVKVDESGKVDKKVLNARKIEVNKTYVVPACSAQISSNQYSFVFKTLDQRYYRIGIFDFE